MANWLAFLGVVADRSFRFELSLERQPGNWFNDVVTGHFLLSLWWRELLVSAVLLALATLISVRAALRGAPAPTPTVDSNAFDAIERPRQLTEL
jgi:hypothetical protein